jgi:hypothetical protein
MNYSNTTTYKTVLMSHRLIAAFSTNAAYVGLYRSTSAITTIKLTRPIAEFFNRLNLHPLRNCECIMANTYEAIATVEVGSGGAANIEFTSIPATYTDLKVVCSLRGTYAGITDDVNVYFNGTNTNRSAKLLTTEYEEQPNATASAMGVNDQCRI